MIAGCPICEAGAPRIKFRKGKVEILECGECGVAFWLPPAEFRPESVYAEGYFNASESNAGYDDYAALEESFRLTFARRLARIQRSAPGARLLDIGAAYGFGVSEAERAGWRAHGLEVSREAAKVSGAVVPHRIVAGNALSLPFASSSFEAVTMWDVIEHLPEPHASISEVARVLKPGGSLVLTTGDVGSWVARLCGVRWHLYTLPEHLFFYTRESLRCLLTRHGLIPQRLSSESSVYTLGYLVERLGKTLLGRDEPWELRSSGWRRTVPVNLFDIVTVLAIREDSARGLSSATSS